MKADRMCYYRNCLLCSPQDHGVETFLIKREEPLCTRRRGPRFSRSRLWSEDERSNNTMSQVGPGDDSYLSLCMHPSYWLRM